MPEAELQLFEVSSTIRAEALPHFLTQNKFFMMGGGNLDLPYFDRDLTSPFDGHITRLSIAFDRRACCIGREMKYVYSMRSKYLHGHPNASDED